MKADRWEQGGPCCAPGPAAAPAQQGAAAALPGGGRAGLCAAAAPPGCSAGAGTHPRRVQPWPLLPCASPPIWLLPAPLRHCPSEVQQQADRVHLCICCHVSAKDQQYVSRTGWARCDQTCDLVLAHQRSTVKSMLTGCAASGDQAVATGSGSLTGAVAMWSDAQVLSHSEDRFLGQH